MFINRHLTVSTRWYTAVKILGMFDIFLSALLGVNTSDTKISYTTGREYRRE